LDLIDVIEFVEGYQYRIEFIEDSCYVIVFLDLMPSIEQMLKECIAKDIAV
jgi:hypothetical protein